MTFLAWISARSRKAALEFDRQSAMTPPTRSKLPRVPHEYLPLYHYLEHRFASLVVLTLEQIESLLGFALPDVARTDPAWWTAARPGTDEHTAAWASAGRVATPNLLARNVAFERP